MISSSVLIFTLSIILIPLAIAAYIQQNSQQNRIRKAWHEAVSRQQNKQESLVKIIQRIEQTRDAEDRALQTLDQLQKHIATLNSDTPEEDKLQQICDLTQTAMVQLSDIMDTQLNTEGEARLNSLSHELAALHADDSTALVALHQATETPEPNGEPDENTPKLELAESQDTPEIPETLLIAEAHAKAPEESRRLH